MIMNQATFKKPDLEIRYVETYMDELRIAIKQ